MRARTREDAKDSSQAQNQKKRAFAYTKKRGCGRDFRHAIFILLESYLVRSRLGFLHLLLALALCFHRSHKRRFALSQSRFHPPFCPMYTESSLTIWSLRGLSSQGDRLAHGPWLSPSGTLSSQFHPHRLRTWFVPCP